MKHYVVGLDGSEHGNDALMWARTVATDVDRIVVAHAWEVPVVSAYEAGITVDVVALEDAANEFVDDTVTDAGDQRMTGRVVTGHPGRALVDIADELAADGDAVDVVVGHSGSSKAALLLGSTANYVIHHTASPVVVVRGECRVPVRTVAVGIDNGKGDDPDAPSLAALRWALTLPGVERVEVHHADFVPGVAAGPLSQPGLESDEAVDEDEVLLRSAISRALEARSPGGHPPNEAEIVPVVGAGTGAFAMIEASRTADLVVVGTHGRSGLMELILGSTSLEVTAHAHCPVVVAR